MVRAPDPQECSSIGRAPVSKTGGCRFESCHSCQYFNGLSITPRVRSLAFSQPFIYRITSNWVQAGP